MENLIQLTRKFLFMPVLASEHGRKVDEVIVYVHWLMIVLFIGWIIYFGYCLLRFRQSRNPKADYDGVKNHASSDNQIHCPVNKPVIINLTSKDVIHSFKVIAFRTTQDAIPGLRIPLHFTPTEVGTYQINCAQLCGNGHAAMSNGRVYVETAED